VRPHNRLVIEGINFIDDEASNYYIVRKYDVTISDSKLTLDIGVWDYYTMINYLDIEAVMLNRCQGDLVPDGQVDFADLALFAGVYGTECESGPNCMGDFYGDADIDGTDLATMIEEFGIVECSADVSPN
jgi:hypothetical protein